MAINSKIQALYLLGISRFLNAIDPRSLDSAFRLTYVNNPAYDRSGVTWTSGAGIYADTHFFTSNFPNGNISNSHIAQYNGNNQQSGGWELGTYQASNGFFAGLVPRYSNDNSFFDLQSATEIQYAGNTDSRYFQMASRLSTTDLRALKNGVRIAQQTAGESILSGAYSFALGGYKNNGANSYAGNSNGGKTQIASFGAGLTDAEAAAYFKRLQAFLIRCKTAGAGNHGILSNGSGYASDVPAVLAANRFSGSFVGNTDSRITLGTNLSLFNSDFSISVFAKIPTLTGGGSIIGGTGSNFQLRLANEGGGGALKVAVLSQQNVQMYTSTGTVATNTWAQITLTRSGNNYSLRINNGTPETFTSSQSFGSTTTYIGMSSNSESITGYLADLRIFNAVITSTDMTNLAAGNEPVTNSIFHLKMNEGAGTTAFDYIM